MKQNTFHRRKIKITIAQSQQEVTAHVYGESGLAVNKELFNNREHKEYVITHINSGLRLLDETFTFKQARLGCIALVTIEDWNHVTASSVNKDLGKKVELIFKFIKEHEQDWRRYFIAVRLGVSIPQITDCSEVNTSYSWAATWEES